MRKEIFIIVVFMLLVVVMTFPLVFEITTHIPGFFSTDESYSVIWNAWRIKYCVLNNLSIKKTDLISYPFGVDFYTHQPIGFLWSLVSIAFSIFTTPILTYNLQVVLNLLLIALFTYFLVRYVTKSRYCGIFSGICFAFSPYIFARSWQHLGETYHWPLPLLLWSLFRIKDDNSLKMKIIFILSLILPTINFNGIYYVFVIGATFLFYLFFHYRRNKAYIRRIVLLVMIASLILIVQFLPILKNAMLLQKEAPSAHNPFRRPFEDLFVQSARPLSYFLPASVHPIFGKFTERFVGTQFYGSSFTEHTLYLGWTALILAFVAFRRWKKNKKLTENREPRTEEFYIGFFLLLALVAWFFSQPPWWNVGPIKIYMPSFFMYKILPVFRAYCRFGIVVMLAVAVLAGFGLKFILEKFKTQKAKIAVTILFCGLVLFEFWNYPPFKVIDVSRVPQVYYWIKEQPGDLVIAEYPSDANFTSEMYRFYQTKHQKKTINCTRLGTYANKVSKTIMKLSEPKTAGVLKWMGVKYVLVHKENYLSTELIEDKEELDKIPKNTGLKFIKSFPPQECFYKDIMCVQKTGPIDVYEVIANPQEPRIKEEEK